MRSGLVSGPPAQAETRTGPVRLPLLPPGYACDDHAALHFHAGEVQALTLRGGTGYRVEPGVERALAAKQL